MRPGVNWLMFLEVRGLNMRPGVSQCASWGEPADVWPPFVGPQALTRPAPLSCVSCCFWCGLQALQQLHAPLSSWLEYTKDSSSGFKTGSAAAAAVASATAVQAVLDAGNLKALAAAVRSLSQIVSHGGGGSLYLGGVENEREFDAFPAGTLWAAVNTAKAEKLRPLTPPPYASLPEDMSSLPLPLGWAQEEDAAAAAAHAAYGADEDEEELRRRMAVRIQRAWRVWWPREMVRRVCWRLRLVIGAR